MNQANFVGRMTADARKFAYQTKDGTNKAMIRFTVAVGYGDNVDFIPVSAYGKTAEIVTKYVHKGDMIAVTGSITAKTTRDRDGNYKNYFGVIASSITLCGSKSADNQKADKKEDVQEEMPLDDIPF